MEDSIVFRITFDNKMRFQVNIWREDKRAFLFDR
jgi:hypothetical protein